MADSFDFVLLFLKDGRQIRFSKNKAKIVFGDSNSIDMEEIENFLSANKPFCIKTEDGCLIPHFAITAVKKEKFLAVACHPSVW